jgi:DNA-binding CsgD family transcriptional regulator
MKYHLVNGKFQSLTIEQLFYIILVDIMFTLTRLLTLLGLRRDSKPRYFELDETLHTALMNLADQEQRPEEEIQADLIAAGLAQHYSNSELRQRWDSLSSRERDVAALTCLGYTNRQIAAKLKVSPDTVKGYVRQVLVKFNLHSKNEIRTLLSTWDFSDWGTRAQY